MSKKNFKMCHIKTQKKTFFFILWYDIAQKKKFSSHFKTTTFELVLFYLLSNFKTKISIKNQKKSYFLKNQFLNRFFC